MTISLEQPQTIETFGTFQTLLRQYYARWLLQNHVICAVWV